MVTKKKRAKHRVSPKKETVIYYFDDEHEYLYDVPYLEPGANLVTHDELEQAIKTKTVILIEGGENGKNK